MFFLTKSWLNKYTMYLKFFIGEFDFGHMTL